ncbi:MAG TPA: hypothetical protein VFD58_11395 [Blastocatellia bacterium]|nr:hypothetical protein [Blastocatellia bacterium]
MIKPAFVVALLLGCAALAEPARAPAQAHPYASAQALPAPAIFGEGAISTGDDESHPAFTPDGRTLYFLKNSPSFSFWTIVVSHFEHGRWGRPEVAPFSGQYSDADPFITPDGRKLFFISTRPVDGRTKQDTDIRVMERTQAGPRRAGAPRAQYQQRDRRMVPDRER